jgi:hypothetical protein
MDELRIRIEGWPNAGKSDMKRLILEALAANGLADSISGQEAVVVLGVPQEVIVLSLTHEQRMRLKSHPPTRS